MQNMMNYTTGVGSFTPNPITTTNWPLSTMGNQYVYPNPVTADTAKLLNSLFNGKICIYTDKLSNKQRTLSAEDAEVYIGSFYPLFITFPFDVQGNIHPHVSLKALHTWFAAEDGFSKFEFRYPENDQEKEQAIKKILVPPKFYIGAGTTIATTPNSTGTAYYPSNININLTIP